MQLAFLTFTAAEWGTWIAMLVYAYGHGGATTAGIVALEQLLSAALYAPIAARIGDRMPAGRVHTTGRRAIRAPGLPPGCRLHFG